MGAYTSSKGMGWTRSITLKLVVIGVSLAVFVSYCRAVTVARGIRVKVRTTSGVTRELKLYSGYYALVVGCSHYRHWPNLRYSLQDVHEVAWTLQRLGFRVRILEDPPSTALKKALSQFILETGSDPNAALLFYFAGHGHTLTEADGTRLGYIVPVDAPDPENDPVGFLDRALSMRQMEEYSKLARARHLLMVFDSCFSGALFALGRARPSHYLREKVLYPVREFLTAGRENEEVPDRSIFKECFIQAIGDGFADLNEDGYVTGEELGSYLEEQVVNYTRGAQHPQFGKIRNPKLDKGDFVFVLSSPSVAGYPVVEIRPVGRGTLRVLSDPPGAEVYIDGALSGRTPLEASVKTGSYTIEVRKSGHGEHRERVKVAPGGTVTVSVSFQERPIIRKRGKLVLVIPEPEVREEILEMLRHRSVPGDFRVYAMGPRLKGFGRDELVGLLYDRADGVKPSFGGMDWVGIDGREAAEWIDSANLKSLAVLVPESVAQSVRGSTWRSKVEALLRDVKAIVLLPADASISRQCLLRHRDDGYIIECTPEDSAGGGTGGAAGGGMRWRKRRSWRRINRTSPFRRV